MAYIGSPAAPTVATVSDGTVTSAKLADDAVTSAKITDGAVTPSDLSTGHPNWDSSGNVGIGTSSPAVPLNVTHSTTSSIRANQTTNGTDVRMVADSSGASIGSYAGTSLYLKANSSTVASFDTNGVFAFNSGYGSVATAYGCRAWVNFDGTGTVAIRASGNVSSITDNGTGSYTVNFTSSFPDGNYAMVASGSDEGSGPLSYVQQGTRATTSCAVKAIDRGGNVTDTAAYQCGFFR